MKKITFLFMLLVTGLAFGQQQEYLLDFEDGTASGTVATWNNAFGGTSPVEIITNPDPNGTNTSLTTKVLKTTLGDPANAQVWAGFDNSLSGEAFGTWKMDTNVASNLTLTMDVHKNYVGTIGIKWATTSTATTFQVTDQNVNNTVVNEWQTLTWTLPTPAAGLETDISDMIVFVDFTDGRPTTPSEYVLYIDNITWNAEKLTDAPAGGSDPTVAAPTPTTAAVDVVSLYSDAYTDIANQEYNPNWGQSTVLEDVMIAGNNTKKYSNMNFSGINLNDQVDAVANELTHLHVDFWSSNSSEFKIKIVDFGANGVWEENGDNVEHEVIYTGPAQGEWVSYDIPLSDFTGLTTKEHLAQVILSSSAASTVYIDNLYFYKEGETVETEPTVAAPTPTAAAADVVSLFSDAYTDIANQEYNPNWGQTTVLEDVMIAGNNTKKYSNMNFSGINLNDQVDAVANELTHLHVDFWSSNSSEFKIKIVDFGANGVWEENGDNVEHEVIYTGPAQGEWVSYDIPLSDFTGLTTKEHLAQVILSSSAASTVFIDNIYFYKEAEVAPTEPTSNAPLPPTRNAADVASIYSDSYSSSALAVTNYNPNWGQSGAVNTDFEPVDNTNTVLAYTNFNYQGTDIGGTNDLSAMEFIHIDVWVNGDPTNTTLQISPINGGTGATGAAEFLVTVPFTSQAWSSVDLPKASFVGMTWDSVNQFKVAANGAGSTVPVDVYIDNLYFYKEGAMSTASFTAGQFEVYPNPTQNVWNIKATQAITAIQVYDVLGKQVLANSYNTNNVELNASSLKSGLYFAKVNTAQGVQTLKLVKK